MGYARRILRWTVTRIVPSSRRELRCSGCGTGQNKDVRFVSGPGAYLCNRCVTLAGQTITPRRPPVDGVRCTFCRYDRPREEVALIGSVIVCAECIGLMDVILEETAPQKH